MKFRKTKEKIVNIAITTEVSTLLHYDADSGDTLRPTEPCNDCLLKPLNRTSVPYYKNNAQKLLINILRV